MTQLIDKAALVAEIERRRSKNAKNKLNLAASFEDNYLLSFLDTLEVKELDLEKEIKNFTEDLFHKAFNADKSQDDFWNDMKIVIEYVAKHFFELRLKAQHDNWNVVDNINPPQADRNKIYCVFTKDRHILATVTNHPKDEELLQWKCTEFPFHRYDMCEGDKYMQIV